MIFYSYLGKKIYLLYIKVKLDAQDLRKATAAEKRRDGKGQ